jgi:hypothetical protein
MDGLVHLVLHRSEEPLGGRSAGIVVNRGGIDIGDLLIKFALRKPDLPNFFQLALKKLIR